MPLQFVSTVLISGQIMTVGCKEIFRGLVELLDSLYGQQEAEAIAYRILDLQFAIGKLDFLLNKEIELPTSWEQIKLELQAGKPFQYVLGKEFFCDLKIGLNESTLIPRPETEELVGLILSKVKGGKILDIGTGSGCIPLSIKKSLPQAEVFAWDISELALDQAKKNAENLQINVDFQLQDVFEWRNSEGNWDVIISNPPYVLEEEKKEMKSHVLDFEPPLALFVPNENPLLYYKAIAEMAKERLNPGGFLYFEINQLFGKEVKQMMENIGFENVQIIKDFRGKERFVFGSWLREPQPPAS